MGKRQKLKNVHQLGSFNELRKMVDLVPAGGVEPPTYGL